jgi:ATP-dependent Clp protease ATP-binding subunit ClpB
MLREEVTAEDIAGVVSRWTGIPVDKMLEGEREKLLQMEQQIGRRVIGQEAAVKAVSSAIRRARAGLQDPNRPMGSFLFLGPTGVGKTELTKALAEFLFDDATAMVRIDMSEFMEKHSVARLIGAPPGYVGYEEGGVLTEAVRRRPYQVVLFDEVEKAHSDVFNMPPPGARRRPLTDGQGEPSTSPTRSSSSPPTSAASISPASPEGQTVEDVEPQVMEVVRGHFRPEFLNRLDEIILFHRLAAEHMAPIVDIQVARVRQLLADRKIRLELSRRRPRLARPGRLRPGLRSASAQAGGAEVSAGPAGGRPAARRRAGRNGGAGRRRGRSADARHRGAEGGGLAPHPGESGNFASPCKARGG